MENTNDLEILGFDDGIYDEPFSGGYFFDKFTVDYPEYLDSLNNYITLIYNTYVLIRNKRFLKIRKYPDCIEIAQKCGFGMLMRHALESIVTSIATENGVEVGGRSVFERLTLLKAQNIPGYDDKRKRILFRVLDLTNEISHPHVLHTDTETFAQLQSFYNDLFKEILDSHIFYLGDLIKNSRLRDFGITKDVLKSRKQSYGYLVTLKKRLENFNVFDKLTNILIQGCLVRQMTECTVNLWGYNYSIVPTDVSTAENQISLSKVLSNLAQISRMGKKTAFGSSALSSEVIDNLYTLKDASNSLMHVDKFATGDIFKKGEELSGLYMIVKSECSPHVMKKKLSESASISKSIKKKPRVKSPVVAALLCGLTGWLGTHHFYVGNLFRGVVYILFGGFIIGPTLDLIKMLKGKFRDVRGFIIEKTQLSSVVSLLLLLCHLFMWYSVAMKLYENGYIDKFKNFNPLQLITMEKFDDNELMNLDRVGVLNCTASSHLVTADASYDPVLCIDSNIYTSWQEGVPGTGEDESLTLTFTQEETISAISIFNGKHTDPNAYSDNARAKRLIVKIGHIPYFIDLDDEMRRQTFAFSSPKKAKEITITIDSTYPGNAWSDLCISEIEFYKER